MSSRRLVGLLTLCTLLLIAVGVSGFQLPRWPANPTQERALPGVRAISSSRVLQIGLTAPAGGELGFLAIEPSGNLLVSDLRRGVLMRFDATGHLIGQWGPRLGDTVLDQPAGLAVQGPNVYALDRGTPRLFRLDTLGQLQATLDLEPFSPYGLNGLTVDNTGNLYVADTGRNRILEFSPTGSLLKTIGRPGSDVGGLTQPMMVAFAPDGSLFVADWENGRIAQWSAQLEPVDAWSTGFRPFGVAVDQLGRVFVPDTDKHRVVVYTSRGAVLGELGGPATPIDVAPRQVALAAADQPSLYVLGSDGLERLELENTAPPPQAANDPDILSVLIIGALSGVLVVAFVSRRGRRRRPASVAPPPDRPVRLYAENGAQREHQEAARHQELLIADQSKRQK